MLVSLPTSTPTQTHLKSSTNPRVVPGLVEESDQERTSSSSHSLLQPTKPRHSMSLTLWTTFSRVQLSMGNRSTSHMPQQELRASRLALFWKQAQSCSSRATTCWSFLYRTQAQKERLTRLAYTWKARLRHVLHCCQHLQACHH